VIQKKINVFSQGQNICIIAENLRLERGDGVVSRVEIGFERGGGVVSRVEIGFERGDGVVSRSRSV
jgi:hypothetical protein